MIAAEPRVLWQPQAGPQTALLECPIFEVFFGGARGGGKTEASLGDWIQHQSLYGRHAVGSFFRRKRVELKDVIARSHELFKPLGATFNQNDSLWKFPNGARLDFGYLERDQDAQNMQGTSRTRIYIEEATNFPSAAPINKLKATLRSAAGVPVGIRLTGNPGGPGHNWVKARYIDPGAWNTVTETEELDLFGEKFILKVDRVFIPSRISDNALLMRNDPMYLLRLRQSGSEALVKAWLEGNWDIIDGAFFSEWDYSKHVLDTQTWLARLPREATRFRAFDWGSAKPFSVGWYAISNGEWGLPKDALLKYREWYGATGPNVGLKLDAPSVARGIKVRELGERIKSGVADPAIFIRNGGPSIGETMSAEGVSWWKADNKRQPGWEEIHHRLKGPVIGVDDSGLPLHGRPMLYFLDCCEDTIRTLPILQHDEDNAEDLDTDGEDHAADELRYAVMSRPYQSQAALKADAPPKPGMFTINNLISLNRKRREHKQHI